MATKIKGIYKGFKFISQIFVMKEREIEIGYPTDVKHVGHIGWDGSSASSPTWMNEFKTPPEFSSATLANTNARNSSSLANFCAWSSQDFDQSIGNKAMSMSSWSNFMPSPNHPSIPKKSKRKKKSSFSTNEVKSYIP